MIKVNDDFMEWADDLSVLDLLKIMGYKLSRPAVLFRVNEEVVQRDRWADYRIPDKAEISVVNLLRGG